MSKFFMIACDDANALFKLFHYKTTKWKVRKSEGSNFHDTLFIETTEFPTEKALIGFLGKEVLNYNRKMGINVYVKEVDDCSPSLIV